VVRRPNRAQSVAVLVALAAVGIALDRAWTASTGGWFGYAPNTDVVYAPGGHSRASLLVLRIAMAIVWATVALVLLRDHDGR
jgi:hypothetical protein